MMDTLQETLGPDLAGGELDGTGTIVATFLEAARGGGDRPYLHHFDGGEWQTLTWAETAQRVMRVAAALVEAGLEPGDHVALLAENRVEWLYCDFGIQAAGGITVPIYPSSLTAGVRHIVEDSACPFAIATAVQAGKLEPAPPLRRVAVIESDVAAWVAAEAAPAAVAEVERRIAQLRPETVSTVIYTSGTTGLPKGVMLPNRNFVEMARHALEVFDIGPDDVLLSFLPYSHVLERMDGIFVPTVAGATIWLARSTDTVIEDIQTVRPTIMLGVPRIFEKVYEAVFDQVRRQPAWKRSLFRWALRRGERAHAAGRGAGGPAHRLADRLVLANLRDRLTGGRLRFFISGGAPLNEKVEGFFWAIGVKILQGWGLTEATSGATSNTEQQHRYRTVGLPLPGVQLRIAPDGEILIKGPLIMAGYANQPEATAATVVDGWLLTGDMGFLDSDGFLTITDRKKDLIKTSGGKYVAPLPIEARMESDRYVRSSLVVGDERPYVVALMVPDWEALAADHGFTGHPSQLKGSAEVRAFFQKRVDECNRELASFETVKRFALLERDFSEDEGELTPSLKPKRRVIAQHFADTIEDLYSAPRGA